MIFCESDRAEEFINTISIDFILRLTEALKGSFKNADLDWGDEGTWFEVVGTVGWVNAFEKTCDEFGMRDLKQYYKELDWFDSDVFDGDVAHLSVEYGLARPFVIAAEDSAGSFCVNLNCEFFDDDETEVS